MITEKHAKTELLKFSLLSKYDGLTHFVSTRKGGMSKSPYNSLNLSFSVGDDPESVKENRLILAEAAGIKPEGFVFQNQAHGNKVRRVETTDCRNFSEHTYSFDDSDALITNETGVCLFVFAADCVPILLFDRKNQAIAAVHSGWRGTAARILSHTLRKMQRDFNTQPKDIIAGIGPAISGINYEVGTQTATEFIKAYGEAGKQFIFKPKGKNEHLDLYAANLHLLVEAGVPGKQIEISAYCTFRDDDILFSARREKPGGRFGAGIMLNPLSR